MRKIDSTTLDILQGWMNGKKPTEDEQEALIARELLAEVRAKAFGINQNNCQQFIEARSQLFNSAYTSIFEWFEHQGIKQENSESLTLLWTFWLPLAIDLAEARQKLGRTPIQGILGGQGTGKSTLAGILSLLLQHLGYTTAVISIDDLYKTYAEREKLQKIDPRLIWRGPPGTHDVDLGLQVLEQCLIENNPEPILIPRFDKSAHNGAGDRIEPEAITSADIVLLEGWFVGVRPLAERVFERKMHPVLTPEDIQFAKDCNKRLKAYLPLWDKLDRLLVLYPEDYRLSKQWRKEAEHKMIAQGRTGMSDLQVEKFVDYYWRSLHPDLFIKPLVNNPNSVDLVVEIKSDHSYGKIYKPQ
ncbi:putative kinase [Hyella patelloides LEGE 07179]|uniref:Putative kinase n=1 Tax=Hyella patelloides LEGE 07179 TaxID=945734 RepID=A0A563VJF1_9CYAN|nr:glycerate kinase [Hyella patelloides]VEP11513.1 putative kinase [Hyella patelloides LEGE 07179]